MNSFEARLREAEQVDEAICLAKDQAIEMVAKRIQHLADEKVEPSEILELMSLAAKVSETCPDFLDELVQKGRGDVSQI